ELVAVRVDGAGQRAQHLPALGERHLAEGGAAALPREGEGGSDRRRPGRQLDEGLLGRRIEEGSLRRTGHPFAGKKAADALHARKSVTITLAKSRLSIAKS